MNRPAMSMNHARIVLGSLSLALFAHSAFWLLYDVIGRGVPGVWSVWTTGPASGLAASSSVDLGLAALQLAAGSATLLRVRGAGGLLLTVCATTLAFRAPVVWYWLLDSPSDPWFGGLDGPSLAAVGTTCVLALLIVLVQAALLLRVRRLEHEEAAREAALAGGVRPVKVTATASCVLLAVLNCFYIARNALTAFDIGPGALGDLLAGKGAGQSVLGVSSPWQWACLTVLCGVGMVLAGRRRPSATGFSLGLAVFMMPTAFTKLWGAADADKLLASPLGTLQSLLELVGSAAVAALIVADIRDDLRPAPADPGPPVAAPEAVPAPEPERTPTPTPEPAPEPADTTSPAGPGEAAGAMSPDTEAGASGTAAADAEAGASGAAAGTSARADDAASDTEPASNADATPDAEARAGGDGDGDGDHATADTRATADTGATRDAEAGTDDAATRRRGDARRRGHAGSSAGRCGFPRVSPPRRHASGCAVPHGTAGRPVPDGSSRPPGR